MQIFFSCDVKKKIRVIGYAVCGTPEEDSVNVVRRHGVKWSHLPESNWWPFDYESNALPTELRWLTALNGLKQIEVRYQFFIRLSRKLINVAID